MASAPRFMLSGAGRGCSLAFSQNSVDGNASSSIYMFVVILGLRTWDAEGDHVTKAIFISYSSQDQIFKEHFTSKEMFRDVIDKDVVIYDFRDDFIYDFRDDFGKLISHIQNTIDVAAAMVLFISYNYIMSKYTLDEFKSGLDAVKKRQLFFVPILMDPEAIGWWQDQKKLGELRDLTPEGGTYAFVDFGPVNIYNDKGAFNRVPAQKIRCRRHRAPPARRSRARTGQLQSRRGRARKGGPRLPHRWRSGRTARRKDIARACQSCDNAALNRRRPRPIQRHA